MNGSSRRDPLHLVLKFQINSTKEREIDSKSCMKIVSGRNACIFSIIFKHFNDIFGSLSMYNFVIIFDDHFVAWCPSPLAGKWKWEQNGMRTKVSEIKRSARPRKKFNHRTCLLCTLFEREVVFTIKTEMRPVYRFTEFSVILVMSSCSENFVLNV